MDAITTNPSLIVQRLPRASSSGPQIDAPQGSAPQADAPQELSPTQRVTYTQQGQQDVEDAKTGGQQFAEPENMKGSLDQTIKQMNDSISQTGLQFTIDSDTHSVVIQVVDKTTKEVIRAIPPEYVLALRKRLAQMGDLRGVLLDHKG